MKNKEKVLIAGAGLTGPLLAVLLAQKGYPVEVIDKRPDPRKGAAYEGRSINLALSNRGLRALSLIGIKDTVLQEAVPMNGRMIHDEKGCASFAPYGKEGQQIYSVSRGGLNRTLTDIAEKEGVKFRFEQAVEGIDVTKRQLDLVKGINTEVIAYDFLFAADGAFSKIRHELVAENRCEQKLNTLSHRYKELRMPPLDGNFAMEPNALHIWPREQFMLIALPNADKTFTCTLFLPFEGKNSFSGLQFPDSVANFFRTHFPDAQKLIPDLPHAFFEYPVSALTEVRSYPWAHENICLIGDAAHAVVPFYGQGMNACFEDCFILNAMLGDGENLQKTVEAFQETRKKDADAIADLALHNFIEMRDLVKDEAFILRKKIEAWLHEALGEKYLPLYTMVTFSDMPYSEALKNGKKQDCIMEKVLALEGIKTNWQQADMKAKILEIVKNEIG
ncbi:FAD-dependent monooxygenase [Cytophagaceae bacterium ABcell3]|nr:FAD-dependent monooxygenase [Cytophagaceae bacterium ABcell3]